MAQFRRFKPKPPQVGEGDVFGQHSVKLILRIGQVGFDKAVGEELESPTWNDPDWQRMIVGLATGTPTQWVTPNERTFRCPKCQDTGFVSIEDVERGNAIYAVTRRCDPCAWRLAARAAWLKKQEAEGGKGRPSKLGAYLDRDDERF